MQHHYLRATRQDFASPSRPLSKYDLDFIRAAHFSGSDVVTVQSFTKFWDWFGKVMHSIRHQKTFGALWLKGYIFNFYLHF